jgi:hypothetical protein
MEYFWQASLNFANKKRLGEKIREFKKGLEDAKQTWPEMLVVVSLYEKMCGQEEFTARDIIKIERATKNFYDLKRAIKICLGDMLVHEQDKAHYQTNSI